MDLEIRIVEEHGKATEIAVKEMDGDQQPQNSNRSENARHELLEAARFAGHTLLGVLIYLVILAAAVLVGFATKWCEERGFIHEPLVLLSLKFAEKALVLTDLFLLVYWLLYSTYRHIRKR